MLTSGLRRVIVFYATGGRVEFLTDSGRDRTYKTVFSPVKGLVDLTEIHQLGIKASSFHKMD